MLMQARARQLNVVANSPGGLLRELFSSDALSNRQFERLKSIAEKRNRLAHGRVGEESTSEAEIRWLLEFTGRLLEPGYVTVSDMYEWLYARTDLPLNDSGSWDQTEIERLLHAEFPSASHEDVEEAFEEFIDFQAS